MAAENGELIISIRTKAELYAYLEQDYHILQSLPKKMREDLDLEMGQGVFESDPPTSDPDNPIKAILSCYSYAIQKGLLKLRAFQKLIDFWTCEEEVLDFWLDLNGTPFSLPPKKQK
jgi:hypothetical protein